MKDKFTASQMAEALIASRGMVTQTAKQLGCDRKTVNNYIKKYPSVAQALEDSRAVLGDRIETTLLHEALGVQNIDPRTQLPDGTYKREPNMTALIFLAKTHPSMRERGYFEKQERAHSGEIGISLTWGQFLQQADEGSDDG